MSRSIVCGIDNSPQARRAAELTVKLARAFRAEPILVHAVDGARALGGKSVLRGRRRDHALRAGAQLAAEIDPRSEATERIVPDRPERALAQVASDTGAMLVAVGSRGHGPLRSALLGSTSRATLRAVDRPVLVVPPGAADRTDPGQSIVCGVDGSRASDYALAAAAELGEQLDLELLLLSVQESASLAAIPAAGVVPPIDVLEQREREEAEQALERAATRLGERLSMRRRINVGGVAAQLVSTAEEMDAELIVIGASESGALDHVLLGSVSAILCRRATCPVVIVPEGGSLKRP